jgi:hypothetical protein
VPPRSIVTDVPVREGSRVEGLRYGREVRWLYQAALTVFLVTIGLGMARGIGLINFEDRNQLLTHLHSGAIGWITLGILATVLWLYGGNAPRHGEEPWVSWTSGWLVVAVPLYVVAWWTGNLPFRAIAGTAVLIGIVAYVLWFLRQASTIGYRNLTTPQLGAVVGLVTLVVGSTLGVLLQIQFASNVGILNPGNAIGAHAETQISAYLVLVAMSIAYWRLIGSGRTARGTWMVWLFFLGGAVVAVALLANIIPLTILYIPLDIAGFALFLTLGWRRVVAPRWLDATAARHQAIAIPFALVYFAIFAVLIGGIATGVWKEITDIPPNLIPAAEHPLFVGMVTNTLFGLLLDLNASRRGTLVWADHVVFWGINLAVAAFTLAILLNATGAFAVIAPVLGLSIFVGIVANTMRLWSRAADVSQEPEPAEAPLA